MAPKRYAVRLLNGQFLKAGARGAGLTEELQEARVFSRLCDATNAASAARLKAHLYDVIHMRIVTESEWQFLMDDLKATKRY
jgi:hypothetical protein